MDSLSIRNHYKAAISQTKYELKIEIETKNWFSQAISQKKNCMEKSEYNFPQLLNNVSL